MRLKTLVLFFALIHNFALAQNSGLKSIDEVIQGIDSLLEQIDQSTTSPAPVSTPESKPEPNALGRSFRMENELFPEPLRGTSSFDTLPQESEPLPDPQRTPVASGNNPLTQGSGHAECTRLQ